MLLCPPGTPGTLQMVALLRVLHQRFLPHHLNHSHLSADPLPHLYDSAMYGAAGLLSVAAVSAFLMRPVHSKWHMKEDEAAVPASPAAQAK